MTPNSKAIENETPTSKNNANPVQVYARVKPSKNPDEPLAVSIASETAVVISKDNVNSEFNMNAVYGPSVKQAELYESVLQSHVEAFLHGYPNFALFAYGMTSSGKTHTVIGSKEDPGFIQRFLSFSLKAIEKNVQSCKISPDLLWLYNFKYKQRLDRYSKQRLTPMKASQYKSPSSRRRSQLDLTSEDSEVLSEEDDEEDYIKSYETGFVMNPDSDYILTFSMVEIYCEVLYDLFDGRKKLEKKAPEEKKITSIEVKK